MEQYSAIKLITLRSVLENQDMTDFELHTKSYKYHNSKSALEQLHAYILVRAAIQRYDAVPMVDSNYNQFDEELDDTYYKSMGIKKTANMIFKNKVVRKTKETFDTKVKAMATLKREIGNMFTLAAQGMLTKQFLQNDNIPFPEDAGLPFATVMVYLGCGRKEHLVQLGEFELTKYKEYLMEKIEVEECLEVLRDRRLIEGEDELQNFGRKLVTIGNWFNKLHPLEFGDYHNYLARFDLLRYYDEKLQHCADHSNNGVVFWDGEWKITIPFTDCYGFKNRTTIHFEYDFFTRFAPAQVPEMPVLALYYPRNTMAKLRRSYQLRDIQREQKVFSTRNVLYPCTARPLLFKPQWLGPIPVRPLDPEVIEIPDSSDSEAELSEDSE